MKGYFAHAPEYINIREMIKLTVHRYQNEIDSGIFPVEKHTNSINESEYIQIEEWCLKNNIKT